ncbi:MAG: HEAT repeat domain-containing protein [Phycisphaeraceae bacterium]|nr:HEAT repeat domain-containing protein [Phycisphaeraceae bacterium]
MVRAQTIYASLRTCDDASVDQAIAAAMPTVHVADMPEVVQVAIYRHRPESLSSLVTHFHRMPASIQGAVVSQAARLDAELRQAFQNRQTQTAVNALKIIQRSRAYRLAYLVSDQLTHDRPALHRAASECLHALTDGMNSSQEPSSNQSAQVRFLIEAVENAASHYEKHAQTEVITSLLSLSRRLSPAARQIFDHPRRPAVVVAQQLLAQPTDPAALRSILPSLAVTSLAPAARLGLHRAVTERGLEIFLLDSHLLLVPAISRSLAHVNHPYHMLPGGIPGALPGALPGAGVGAEKALSPQALQGLPRWIAALPLPPKDQAKAWADLAGAEDPLVRSSALRCLFQAAAASDDPEYLSAIAVYTAGSDPDLARIALRYLIRCSWSGLDALISKLLQSPFPHVVELAQARLAAVGFDRLWRSWPKLSAAQRLASGAAAIRLVPTFFSQLGAKLAAADRAEQLRALAVVQELNQGQVFERLLLRLSRHKDDVIASSAVGALGAVGSIESLVALEAALNHTNARVRANAVEALEKLRSQRHLSRLRQMAQHDHARPRANAIHTLLRKHPADAICLLNTMLTDKRTQHRLSALWLVESAGALDVAHQVGAMSINDPDLKVRLRARDVMANLIARLRQSAHPHMASTTSA